MGSEMCWIRACGACDRIANRLIHQSDDLIDLLFGRNQRRRDHDEVRPFANEQAARASCFVPVSYTHLTLPTIYSV